MASSPKYLILEKNPEYHELKIKEYLSDLTPYEYLTRRIIPLYAPAFIGMYFGTAVAGPPGAIIGGGAGLIGGACITRELTLNGFKTWEHLSVESKVFQEFENTYPGTPELIDLRCPISMRLISDPVKTPFGDFYERKSLEKCAALTENGIIRDPQGKGCYKLTDLVDAPEFIVKMKNTFKKLLYKEMITQSLSSSVSEGLGLLIVDLDKQVVNYVFKKTNLLLDQLYSGQITLEQYNNRVADLTKITTTQI